MADTKGREVVFRSDPLNEQVVLAAVLAGGERAASFRAEATRHPPDAFLTPEHATIWKAVREAENRKLSPDPATLNRLSGGEVDVSYLAELMAARPDVPDDDTLRFALDALAWDRQKHVAVTGPIDGLLEAIQKNEPPERVRGLARAVSASFDGWGARKYLHDPEVLVAEQVADVRQRMSGRAVYPYGLAGLDFFEPEQGEAAKRRLIPGAAPGQVTVVTGVPGCLSGETIVEMNRAGISKKIRLDAFVHRFNGGTASGKVWRSDIETTLRYRDADGFVRLGRVVDARSSGMKTTRLVAVEGGSEIRATDDHQFFAESGWKRLSELRAGDRVWVDAGVVQGEKRPSKKRLYKQVCGLKHHPHATSPNMRHKSRRFAVPLHRIVFEARANEVAFDDFVRRLREGSVKGLWFVDPKKWTVHHRDEDPTNNDPMNLELLPRLDHYEKHGRDGGWKHVTARTKLAAIVGIAQSHVEETFDVEMACEPHNFLANGFVVHNSGKSTACARLMLGLARQRRRVLCGAWEMTGGTTLELMACLSLGWSRADLTLGNLAEEQLAELAERMTQLAKWVRFLANPFRRGSGGKPSNERNLDAIHGYLADSGCTVFVADLWKRALVDARPEDEEEALYRQQAMCEELGIHAILVQQQRLKDIELRPDKRPTREGIKGSGAWTEVADTILGVHRPALWKNITDNVLEIDVLKQRHGKWPLAVEFDWDPERGMIAGGRTVEYEMSSGRDPSSNPIDMKIREPRPAKGGKR